MKKRILVVDDNEAIIELVTTILESAGYSYTKTSSGRKCLELLQKDNERFDLILMDIAMPEITGIDVLNTLKQDGIMDGKKIVFFTASSITDSDKEGLIKLGALDCIRKPFSKAEILEAIAKYTKT